MQGVKYGKLFKISFEVEVSIKCKVAESKRNMFKRLGYEGLRHVNLRAD